MGRQASSTAAAITARRPVGGRLARQRGILEEQPEGEGDGRGLEQDDPGEPRRAERQVQDNVEEPLGIVVLEGGARRDEDFVGGQAPRLDHETAEGQMGPGVGILDPGDGQRERCHRHQGPEAPRARTQGHARRLQPLDDGAYPLPEADAHGLKAVALLAALELVEQRVHEPCARAAERMAERDGAAVDVDAFHVGVELHAPTPAPPRRRPR